MRRIVLTLPLALLTACTAAPPAHWAQGGALLDIPRARWVRGPLTVDIAPDGKIFINGDHELTVDRGGRIYDLDAAPVALLERDGKVVGPDDRPLGYVGELHASLPGEPHAWITVTRAGEVVRYDDDGEASGFGVWMGCDGSPQMHQTCTLVTHVVGMYVRDFERRSPGLAVGVGIGIGIPIR